MRREEPGGGRAGGAASCLAGSCWAEKGSEQEGGRRTAVLGSLTAVVSEEVAAFLLSEAADHRGKP